MAVNAKKFNSEKSISIVIIQVNWCCLLWAPHSPELLLKFLPLTYDHSHFLAATLDFTVISFFTQAIEGRTFFTA